MLDYLWYLSKEIRNNNLFVFYPDVALVTSLRDGMNLVSYEFVACQDSKKGVLILSEVNTITPYLC